MGSVRFSIFTLIISGVAVLSITPVKADAVSAAIVSQMKSPDLFNPDLGKLVGNWKGKGKLRPARRFPKSSVKCRLSAKWIEGGRVIKQDMKCKSLFMNIKRTTYIAYDKATKRYVGKDFGNMGPDNVTLSGTGSGGNFNLLMAHRKPGSGKIVHNSLVIKSLGKSAIRTTMTKVSSRPYEVMNVRYKRQGGTI